MITRDHRIIAEPIKRGNQNKEYESKVEPVNHIPEQSSGPVCFLQRIPRR